MSQHMLCSAGCLSLGQYIPLSSLKGLLRLNGARNVSSPWGFGRT